MILFFEFDNIHQNILIFDHIYQYTMTGWQLIEKIKIEIPGSCLMRAYSARSHNRYTKTRAMLSFSLWSVDLIMNSVKYEENRVQFISFFFCLTEKVNTFLLSTHAWSCGADLKFIIHMLYLSYHDIQNLIILNLKLIIYIMFQK